MNNTSALALASLFALSLGACTTESSDEDVETDDGELRVSGSTLGSRFAKSGTAYLSARTIASLEKVGALHGALGVVAARADGIIATAPADGQVSAKELVQMESPAIFPTLFPEEQAALEAFWKLMEAARGNIRTTQSLAASFALTTREVSTPPGTLTPPAQIALTTLSTLHERVARRVQLTRNSDNDPNTISQADLNGAIAAPGAYTPDEVEAMKAMLVEFQVRATSSYAPLLEVTKPEVRVSTLGTFGALTFTVEDSISYEEARDMSLSDARTSTGPLNTGLSAITRRQLSVSTSGAPSILFVNEQSGAEFFLDASLDAAKVPVGRYTVETWENSAKTGSYHIRFRDEVANTGTLTDLSQYVDYELVSAGVPLVRNLKSAAKRAGAYLSARYTFDTTTKAPEGTPDMLAANRLQTPTTIPSGRYEMAVHSGSVSFDISSSGVVWFAGPGGTRTRAQIYLWDNVAKFTTYTPNDDVRTVLNPGSLDLTINARGSSLFQGKLDPAKRKG